jgi:hypothetical protein
VDSAEGAPGSGCTETECLIRVKSAVLTTRRSLPVYPGKQTLDRMIYLSA